MSDFSGMTSLNPGYRALVLGASGGIGGAFASAIKADPACGSVVELSRSRDGFDITDDASVGAAAAPFSEAGQKFDLILCATGALVINGNGPEKTIKAIQGDVMAAQFALNAIGPALALKHFAPSPLQRGQERVCHAVGAGRLDRDNKLAAGSPIARQNRLSTRSPAPRPLKSPVFDQRAWWWRCIPLRRHRFFRRLLQGA